MPTYYACDNDKISTKSKQVGGLFLLRVIKLFCIVMTLLSYVCLRVQRKCFECCRSACIVDEFAQGGSKKGFTYTFCDRACYQYCGYVSGRTRRLLSVESLLQSKHDALAQELIWGHASSSEEASGWLNSSLWFSAT